MASRTRFVLGFGGRPPDLGRGSLVSVPSWFDCCGSPRLHRCCQRPMAWLASVSAVRVVSTLMARWCGLVYVAPLPGSGC